MSNQIRPDQRLFHNTDRVQSNLHAYLQVGEGAANKNKVPSIFCTIIFTVNLLYIYKTNVYINLQHSNVYMKIVHNLN